MLLQVCYLSHIHANAAAFPRAYISLAATKLLKTRTSFARVLFCNLTMLVMLQTAMCSIIQQAPDHNLL